MTLQEFTDIISEILFVEYEVIEKIVEKEVEGNTVLTVRLKNEDIFKINISKIKIPQFT